MKIYVIWFNKNTIKYYIILFGLGGVLMSAPFFQGLYYDLNVLIYTFLIGLITLLAIDLRRPAAGKTGLPEYLLAGLAIWYLATLPWAVDKGNALSGSVRMLAYAALFFTANRILTVRTVKVGAWLLVLTGSLVTLVGIGSAVNLPPYNGSWGPLLSSVFQYHNALGAYMLMTIPVAMWLYREAGVYWERYLAAGGLYLQLVALVASGSRGAWVIALVVFVFSIPAFYPKAPFLVLLGAAIWAAADTWMRVFPAGANKSLSVFLWPVVGLAVILLSEWVWHGVRLRSVRWLRMAGAAVILVLLIVGSLPVASQQAQTGSDLINRAASIEFEDRNWQERLAMYNNAWQMGLTRPLTGFGANGWPAAYRGFQSYSYNSKETHSQPLKVLVETGFPGFILCTVFYLVFFVRWWRTRRTTAYLLGLGAVGTMLHSLMDFDLSESAIFFTLLLLIAGWRIIKDASLAESSSVMEAADLNRDYDSSGMASIGESSNEIGNENSYEVAGENSWKLDNGIDPSSYAEIWQRKSGIISRNRRPLTAVMILMSVILLIGSSLLEAGIQYARAGNKALATGQLDQAIQNNYMALRYNPFQAKVLADLAQIEVNLGLQAKDNLLVGIALSEMNKAITLNSTDPLLHSIAAKVFLAAGQPDVAVQEAKESLRLAPLQLTGYEGVAYYSLQDAQQLLLQSKAADTNKVLQNVFDLPKQIEQRLNNVKRGSREQGILSRQLVVTPHLRLYLGQAEALRGNWDAAMQVFTSLSTDKNLAAEALLWKGSVEKRLGNSLAAADLQSAIDLDRASGNTQNIEQSMTKLDQLLSKVL